MMICANRLCIYYSEGECTIDDISLDIDGRCEECIYVNFEEETLQKYRKKMLDEYDSIEKEGISYPAGQI